MARAAFILMALVVAVFSFVRLTDRELRRHTKAIEGRSFGGRRIKPTVIPGRGAGAPKVVESRPYVAPGLTFPRPESSTAPASPWVPTIGTTRRWAALGGHGRNGPG